jgi:class 3 adenylate cyclase/tetratricopeptide (TPR) repeat protein
MASCAACGATNPAGFRFCGACGAALAAERRPSGEERKLVTVLFCDLVGFTARSDQADPEDVGALLRPYHVRLRGEIERLGGTLDKFIGDAVMAVFGAPVAHEDDPERAVRCALRMLDAIAELNEATPALALSVRIGVNTGEALVRLGPDRQTETVVGDVVNTASRLQGIAPPGGVVVGEPTWRATGTLFEFEQLDAVRVKGKAQPLAIWRVAGARSRLGVDADPRPVTPFIGRAEEFESLRQAYRQVLRAHSAGLVTVVGEPGVGKSRLVQELLRFVDAQDQLVAWRHAHCLPYGDGITFWALGEIVKAQAGILESDLPAPTAAKLAAAVEAVVDDPAEREWLKARLGPLVGLATDETVTADRTESFTAWRRFLEAVATRNPLVGVIEDLHWADPALIGFLQHLARTSTGVDLLVVATARTQLHERHPGWDAGLPAATTITLPPLSDQETARLVAAMLGQPVLPADVQTLLLERAEGNPLYAEEFVRLLTDRGLLVSDGRTVRLAADAEITVPETLQALIAARLDTLPPTRKALVQDAAVVGKVFWSGALARLGGVEERTVLDELRALERTQLIRPTRPSSVEHQAEYAFWHALVKDVAYRQIPRSGRARRHQATAEWLAELAPERAADRAEVIAHHYRQALTLTRAATSASPARIAELEPPTRRFLALAGDRALGLDVASAKTYYRDALELCPPEDPELGGLLLRHARATFQSGGLPDAAAGYQAAIAAFARHGDRVGQGEALDRLCVVLWHQGETQQAKHTLIQSIELLESTQPGNELCSAYTQMAAGQVLAGHSEDALAWADKALALAEELGGLPEVRLRALDARGMARCDLGDLGALDDLREALDLGRSLGAGHDTAVVYNNLVEPLWVAEGPATAVEMVTDGIDFAERRGLAEAVTWLQTTSLGPLADLGRWDELLGLAERVIARDRADGGRYVGVWAQVHKAYVLGCRGQLAAARALVGEFLPAARKIDDLQVLVPALATAALIGQADGEPQATTRLVAELRAATAHGGGHWYRAQHLADLARLCVAAGEPALAEELVSETRAVPARHRLTALSARAALAEARGDLDAATGRYEQAASGWAAYGHVLEHGQALLGAARCLLRADRADAPAKLRAARGIFTGLGAHPLTTETDTWLVDATA